MALFDILIRLSRYFSLVDSVEYHVWSFVVTNKEHKNQ